MRKHGIYVGDRGTEVILNTGVDLRFATQVGITVTTPRNTRVFWPGEVVDETKVRYVTSMGESDWPASGVYRLQAFADTPEWSGHGATVSVTVKAMGV